MGSSASSGSALPAQGFPPLLKAVFRLGVSPGRSSSLGLAVDQSSELGRKLVPRHRPKGTHGGLRKELFAERAVVSEPCSGVERAALELEVVVLEAAKRTSPDREETRELNWTEFVRLDPNAGQLSDGPIRSTKLSQ